MRIQAAACGMSVIALIAVPVLAQAPASKMPPQFQPDPKLVERGRYLVVITGCNDCHTPGYVVQNGKIDQDKWLLGDTLGFRGPRKSACADLRINSADLGQARDRWVPPIRQICG